MLAGLPAVGHHEVLAIIIYIYIYTHMYMYTYIYREREREILHIYIYIYIYRRAEEGAPSALSLCPPGQCDN